jgi:transposase
VAGDSTGFESRHTSRYYAFRRDIGPYETRRYPKLSAVCDCATHLVLSAKARVGPSYDCRDGPSMLRSAAKLARPGVVLLDAGYDSEPMHELIRWELGAESVIPATRGYPTTRPLKGPNRQRMREEFPRKLYGQRWQIESVFSRIKRRYGSVLSAKLDSSRSAQAYARFLAHNLAILIRLLPQLCNRATLRRF